MHRCADDLITRRHALLVDKKASAGTSVRTPTPAAPARMLLRPARPPTPTPALRGAHALYFLRLCGPIRGRVSIYACSVFGACRSRPSALTRSCGSWVLLQHVQHQI